MPGRGHVSFKCTFPSKYISSNMKLARVVDDDRVNDRNRYSHDDTLFGRKQGSLIAYTWPVYYGSFWQQGYYMCTLKTAHGDIVRSRKVFVLVEGTFHIYYLACIIDAVEMYESTDGAKGICQALQQNVPYQTDEILVVFVVISALLAFSASKTYFLGESFP